MPKAANGTAEAMGTEFAETATTLLKDYVAKLEAMQRTVIESRRAHLECEGAGAEKSAKQRWCSDQFEAVRREFFALNNDLEQLARRVSQQLEHGAIADTAKLELKTRLAEFEAKLQSTAFLIQNSTAQFR